MKFTVKDVSLEVVEQGEGEPVLFVHGSNSDYRTWYAQQEAFAEHYHTINYSRRYHYPNETIGEGVDYAMAEQLDDLQFLIQELDTDAVHLVGHSYGAFLGLLLAMEHPQLLRSLVLTEPPIFTLFISIPPKPQEILKLLFTQPRTAINIIRFAATGLVPATKAAEQDDLDEALRIFGSAVMGRETFNSLSDERLAQARQNMFKAELLGSGFLPLSEEDIKQIQLPVLLINGMDSPALFHRFLDRLQMLLPDAERVKIPNASHIVHEDNASAYNTQVLSFLKNH